MEIADRSSVLQEHTWDLTRIYPDETAWRSELEQLERECPKIVLMKGIVGRSPEEFERSIRAHLKNSQTIEKLYTYAHLLSDSDLGNAHHQGLLQQIMSLYTRYMGFSAFLLPEIIELDSAKLEKFLAKESMRDLVRVVRDIVRYRPHTLSHKEEEIIALGGEVFSSCQRVYSQLNNADLQFGTIQIDGEARPLTHSSYSVFLKNSDRKIRREAFEKYYSGFESHKNTVSALLTGSIQRDVYLAKVKRFPSAIERSLFADNITSHVYTTLIDTVSKHLKTLHRYYALRKKVLGLEPLELYDTYLPLVPDIKMEHTYQAACEMVISSVAPLGTEYSEILSRGLLEERWVDIYENKGKRSGAYSSGCYDSVPYLLLNYKKDSFNDIFTLTHEAAHSMHTYLSNQNQLFQDHHYTIFVAEVASTFNEQLLMRHLRGHFVGNDLMLTYLINHHVEDIKSTLFRQTMFAEFEMIIHGLAERNEPLTLDSYREVYRGLLIKYFGPSVNITAIAELEFLRIPHFYSPFYVYKYATGLAAAIALSNAVIDGGTAERDRYLNFLKSGCSKYPLEQLADAGVDMCAPEPVNQALQLFEVLVTELESRLT